MHVSLITTNGPHDICSNCKKAGKPTAKVFVDTPEGQGTSEPLCGDCFLTKELSLRVDIEKLEVEVSGKRKVLKSQKKRSQKQELEIAEELGGKVQAASGAMPGSKGDIRVKGAYRLEAKFTKAGSYSLKLEDLQKIMGECHELEKPVFVIDFLDRNGRTTDRYAVLPWEDFKDFVNAPSKHR